MKRLGRHTQRRVEYDGRLIEVDEGIADLLVVLWAKGFKTFGSCQEFKRGGARIWFSDAESLARFHKGSHARVTDLAGGCVQFPSSEISALEKKFKGAKQ